MRGVDILRMKGGGGGAGATLRVDDGNYTFDSASADDDAEVALYVENNGTLTISADNGTSYSWVLNGDPLAYEVRATATVGTVSTGTVGSWLALTSTRTWTVYRGISGVKSCTLLIEIGLAGASTALESGSIQMQAVVPF